MKAYICDINDCGKIIRDGQELCHVELSGFGENLRLDLCEECYFKVKELILSIQNNSKEPEIDSEINELYNQIKKDEASSLDNLAAEEKDNTKTEDIVEISIVDDKVITKLGDIEIEEKHDLEADKAIIDIHDSCKKANTKKDSTHRKTIAEHIEGIGGIDVLMTAICKKEKSITDFEEQFGLGKNSLRTYLSINKISVKAYAESHGIQLGRKTSNKNAEIALKIKEIGLDNILESLANKKTTTEQLAKDFGVTKSQLNSYFHTNYISVSDYKKKRKQEQKKAESLVNSTVDMAAEIKRISDKSSINMGLRTVATCEMKHLEKQIDVVSGSCFRCGYRDLDSNTCGYTILTGKSRRGGKGKCCHFVDVDKL